jgi:hypothetical protein
LIKVLRRPVESVRLPAVPVDDLVKGPPVRPDQRQ